MKKRALYGFLINNLLIVTGLIMILSGLVMQVEFHMGDHENHLSAGNNMEIHSVPYEQAREIDMTKTIWGFNYLDWSTIHKVIIILFSLIMAYHIYSHWKWYKGIISKNLIRKNIQVITLTILFLLVALTGIIPWIADISGDAGPLRFILIEIHDKLTLLLIVYLVLHVVKRFKWFKNSFVKLVRNHS